MDAALTESHVWQRRFYDFVVFTAKKRVEKLRYMHRNPVVRGLVLEPEQWQWSSHRSHDRIAGEKPPGSVVPLVENRDEWGSLFRSGA